MFEPCSPPQWYGYVSLAKKWSQTSGHSDPKWPGKLHRPRKVDAYGNPIPESPTRAKSAITASRLGTAMRPYTIEDDSDGDVLEVLPAPKVENKTSKRSSSKPGRGRGGRAKTTSRDRSRSTVPDDKKLKSIQRRSPRPSAPVDDHDGMEGLRGIAAFNAGFGSGRLDPANVPQEVKKRGRGRPKAGDPKVPKADPPIRRGTRPGTKLHWWTPEEMLVLEHCGTRVSQGLSKWQDEAINLPPGVTLKNASERYWRYFKRTEAPKLLRPGAPIPR